MPRARIGVAPSTPTATVAPTPAPASAPYPPCRAVLADYHTMVADCERQWFLTNPTDTPAQAQVHCHRAAAYRAIFHPEARDCLAATRPADPDK